MKSIEAHGTVNCKQCAFFCAQKEAQITANRVKGSLLENDICKNYRREGLFFDEILNQAAGGKA